MKKLKFPSMKISFPRMDFGFGLSNTHRDFILNSEMDNLIKNQAKKEKSIIFGAQSIKAQLGAVGARATSDWDIFAHKPKSSARITERSLDNLWGSNHFYTKPAMHPGTTKVMSAGDDGKHNTTDDFGVVDYSKIPPRIKTTRFLGNRYRQLSSEKSAKYKALRDKTQEFRWEKDREDVERIKLMTGKKR